MESNQRKPTHTRFGLIFIIMLLILAGMACVAFISRDVFGANIPINGTFVVVFVLVMIAFFILEMIIFFIKANPKVRIKKKNKVIAEGTVLDYNFLGTKHQMVNNQEGVGYGYFEIIINCPEVPVPLKAKLRTAPPLFGTSYRGNSKKDRARSKSCTETSPVRTGDRVQVEYDKNDLRCNIINYKIRKGD